MDIASLVVVGDAAATSSSAGGSTADGTAVSSSVSVLVLFFLRLNTENFFMMGWMIEIEWGRRQLQRSGFWKYECHCCG